MEIKTSKIKNVQSVGTWESKHDQTLMYKYEYDFEDGGYVQASHKTPIPYKAGDEVEYQITHPDKHYGKVNKPKPQFNGFKKQQQNSVSSFALSYAKDWCLGIHNAGTTQTPDDVIAVAEVFNKWLKENQ